MASTEFTVIIKDLTGAEHQKEVQKETTTLELHEIVQDLTGLPID
jgi:hypothetical protein